MFERHIRDQLTAYLDGEMDARLRGRVEAHLAKCERCRQELDQLRMGSEMLQQLPVVAAPEGLWRAIEQAADAPAKQTFRPAAGWAWALAGLVLAVVSTAYWMYSRPAGPTWEVSRLGGSPVAGNRPISGTARVPTGQWIETDDTSRARIRIGEIGAVEVEPNSRIRLAAVQNSEHRLALGSGGIKAKISAPPRLFFVDTPAGTAVDLGCEYQLHCDRQGTGLLRVTGGWVSFERDGKESLVPAGASCRIRSGMGPGTPWFDDAPRKLLAALDRFDAGQGNQLEVVLTEARVRDTLTLWHLLSRTSQSERIRVWERLAALAPPPDGVSRERVLQLDPASLAHWKDELAWTW